MKTDKKLLDYLESSNMNMTQEEIAKDIIEVSEHCVEFAKKKLIKIMDDLDVSEAYSDQYWELQDQYKTQKRVLERLEEELEIKTKVLQEVRLI